MRSWISYPTCLAVAAILGAAATSAEVAEDQRLFDIEAEANARFGTAVAADAGWAVIGEPGYNGFAGSALMWAFATAGESGLWIRLGRLEADSPDEDAQFGREVAISEDVVVSGDVLALRSGSLEIFRYDGDTWSAEDDLGPASSFSLHGDRIVVGDPSDDELGNDAGAAIVYRHQGTDWVLEQTLRASDGEAGDRFGSRVALVSGRALIFAGGALGGVGSGYVFDREGVGWAEIEKLVPSDAVLGDQFGSGIAVTERAALMGAPWFTRSVTQDGLTYAYDLPVPEPGSALLTAAALAALGAVRRRQRST
jgi:hypothetical protein